MAAEYYRYKGYSVIITMPKKMSLVCGDDVIHCGAGVDHRTTGERSRLACARGRGGEDTKRSCLGLARKSSR